MDKAQESQRGYWSSVVPRTPGFYWIQDLHGVVSVAELTELGWDTLGYECTSTDAQMANVATLWWSETLAPPRP